MVSLPRLHSPPKLLTNNITRLVIHRLDRTLIPHPRIIRKLGPNLVPTFILPQHTIILYSHLPILTTGLPPQKLQIIEFFRFGEVADPLLYFGVAGGLERHLEGCDPTDSE